MSGLPDKQRWRLQVWRLAESINAHRVVEVGVFRGATSIGFMALPCVTHLWLVDPWSADSGESISYEMTQKEWDEMADKVALIAPQQAQAFETRLHILRMTSRDAAQQLRTHEFDFVYIDGDHDYRAVHDDVRAWRPLVRPGGILCGDDYDKRPVREAVNKWAAQTDQELWDIEGRTWVVSC